MLKTPAFLLPLALGAILLSSTVSAEVYDIKKFGAVGNGEAKDTAAIQAAIDACGKAGGGTVYLPAGNYLCGSLRLVSHTRLLLDAGATLRASRDPADYKDDRCLLIARDAERITLAGPGAILGIGEADLGRRADRSDAKMPDFRAGTLRFDDCKDVAVRELTILSSDRWTLHFHGCENVLVDGVTIRNNYFHTNSDGIDPVSCRNVRIANCHIVAGDDCIVIKTADKKPCENVVVTNCTLESIATALKLGTESSGDFRNIHFSNCSIRNSTVGIGLFMKDGGTMERVSFSNIDIETCTLQGATNLEKTMFPIFVDIEKRNPDSTIGSIRDLTFDNLQITSGSGILVQGIPERPLENVSFRNVTFRVTKAADYSARKKHIGGRRTTSDPRDTLYARRPGYLVAAHIDRLVVDGLQVFIRDEDFQRFERSALDGNELTEGRLVNIFRRPAGSKDSLPAITLQDCRDMKTAP